MAESQGASIETRIGHLEGTVSAHWKSLEAIDTSLQRIHMRIDDVLKVTTNTSERLAGLMGATHTTPCPGLSVVSVEIDKRKRNGFALWAAVVAAIAALAATGTLVSKMIGGP